jgi:hypothetical protein
MPEKSLGSKLCIGHNQQRTRLFNAIIERGFDGPTKSKILLEII